MAENWWEEDELVSSEDSSETSSNDNWWEEDKLASEVDIQSAADPVAVGAQEQSFEQPASKLDPAVTQEIEDRQSMIDMMGVDPYTGSLHCKIL